MVPALIYGTAWKEERTEALTTRALEAGFRAIDTANQRKHYVEAGVGAAIASAGVPRAELFLQTKFTYVRGQDHRLPYDRTAGLAAQLAQSFDSSCVHLGTDVIDSYLLHGPWAARGWSAEDREVWRAMESLHDAGRVRFIGVSNASAAQLAALCDEARVPPAFVQNRCHASTGWDRDVREVCRERGVTYQGFSLLTANRRELDGYAITSIAERVGATVAQVVFRFSRAIGIVPLTGTTDSAHMAEDLAAEAIDLDGEDIAAIETLGAG